MAIGSKLVGNSEIGSTILYVCSKFFVTSKLSLSIEKTRYTTFVQ